MTSQNKLAFPSGEDETDGMTLRDYFAAKAMQGEMAAQSETYGAYIQKEDVTKLAEMSYRVADAMLKARESK